MKKLNNLYEEITNKIIDKLKEGNLIWRRSWLHGLPQNYISRKVYQGINYLNLCFEDYPSQYYLTYLQCQNKDGFVNKGAKSKSIIYWKISEIDNGDTVKRVPLLRLSNVFNISETSLFDSGEEIARENIYCQAIIDNMPNPPIIKHNFNRCYYNPAEDYISIPRMSDFDSEGEYYSSLFHEMIHSTGNSSRIGRFNGSPVDPVEEELIAELGSSFLCAIAGISPTTIENQASYIKSWLSKMSDDKMFIVRVSHKAKLAVNWVLGNV